MAKYTNKKEEIKDNTYQIAQQRVVDFIKNYDRFIYKLAVTVKAKCSKLEIEDIKQQINLTLLMSKDNFDKSKDKKSSNYFSQVATNAAHNIIKKYWQDKNKVNVECVSLDAYITEEKESCRFVNFLKESDGSFLYPRNFYIKQEFERRIKNAKTFLSPLERKIFAYYLKGMEIEEIAIKINKSKKTVYNVIAGVRDKLKEMM